MTNRRSTSVDLIKILGCFFVTALHINSSLCTFIDPDIHTFFLSLFLLGVPVFLMQAGFFIFRPLPVLKRYGNFFLKLLIPTILAGFVLTWLYPWTIGERSVLNTILHPDTESLVQYLNSLLNWVKVTPEGPTSHLWYMIEYAKCILIAPLFSLVCSEEKEAVRIRRIFLLILLVYLFVSDLAYLTSLSLPSFCYMPFSSGLVYMLCGYEIYTHRESFRSKKVLSLSVSAILFILLVIVRLLLINSAGDAALVRLTDYNSILSLVQSACLLVFCLCLPEINGRTGKIISYIGARTFLIYLIHLIFAQKAITRELTDAIHTVFSGAGAAGEVLYCLFMGLVIFVIALITASILHEIWSRIRKIIFPGRKKAASSGSA